MTVKKHAYVEHRPLSTNKDTATTSHVVIVDGKVVHTSNTEKESETWAISKGYAVHVARDRHLQNHDIPDFWRHL